MPNQRLLGVMAAAFVLAAILMLAMRQGRQVPDKVPPIPRIAVSPSSAAERSDLRSYAVALPELQGLSPDAKPGSAVELWVTWDTPGGRKPRLEPLIERAVLERIVPPLTPGAPDTALLKVPSTDIPDLLFADRYGLLSATVVPT
jgi:hypothetical protein